VTKKGKVFKFDDLNCLSNYLKSGEVTTENIEQVVSVDFKKTGSFVDAQKAFFLHNEAIRSPMRADIASFSDIKDLEVAKAEVAGGKVMNWEEVKASF
jgi:copper chaperone NosL